MRKIIAFAILSAAGLVSPVSAQPSNELNWAITNCLANIQKLSAARKAFDARKYAYELEDYGIGPEGQIHWHTSPDRTVNVGVSILPSSAACRITPKGMTVGQAVSYAKSAGEAVLKTSFSDGSPKGGPNITPNNSGRNQSMCSGSWARFRDGVVHVTAGSEGQDPACNAGLPAQIIVSFTKG